MLMAPGASHDALLSFRNAKVGLATGSPEIVDKIARVTLSINGKVRNNYSFATKYCSWHNGFLS